MSPLIDSFHCFFCHLLKENNVKILRRIKNIYQMMRHTVHLFRTDLGRADVHLPVDLHRVSRNDLSADCFGKSDGGSSLPDSSWSGQNDKWAFVCLFHLYFLDSFYTIRLNFFSRSRFVMAMIVGRPCGQ